VNAFRYALAALLALSAAAPALAHDPSVARLDAVVDSDDPHHLSLELDLALKDLALTLPLDANHDEAVTWGELAAARPAIEALVERHVSLAGDDRACRLQPTGLATRRYDDGAYATVQMEAACTGTGRWALGYTLFQDRDPQHRAIATLHDGAASATGIAGLGAASRVTLAPGHAAVLPAFLREGVHHLLLGADHIAFLLSLVLPVLLAWNGQRWILASPIRPQLLQALGLVTAFTLAHSITLTLAALGWVTPVSRWVESAIAMSVLLAALNNVRPLVTQRLWLLSFGFGLVHGFGFAGALGELDLPDHARVQALFGFNLGVELGQLAVLAAALPLLFVVRRQAWYARWAVPGVSLAIATVAAAWFVQRVGG
jgi:hypothetical protein